MEGEETEYHENQSNVRISVSGIDLKSEKIRKHALYSISGQDTIGPFASQRRYKEFASLHYILTTHWPGLYIPHIPPKQMIGNLASDFIEVRRQLLDYFLKSIAAFPYLYTSEPFQTFIRGPVDYLKPAADFKLISYPIIGQGMLKTFPDYTDFQVSQEHESQIEDANQYFQNGLAVIEKFAMYCKDNVAHYGNLKNDTKSLTADLAEISGFYAEKYGGTPVQMIGREETKNPYEDMLAWARREILDLKGVVEAIQIRQSLFKVKAQIEIKLDSERTKLQKALSGKKTIGQMFSKKSKEDRVSSIESEIRKNEEEIESINMIVKISTALMIREMLSGFKEAKVENFERNLKEFTGASIKEYNVFINEARNLEGNLTYSNE